MPKLLQSCPSVWSHGQTPLSMGFSRQEYWSGLPCPPPGDLPDPGIELASLASPVLTGGFFTTSTTWEAPPYGCVLVAQSCPTLWNPMTVACQAPLSMARILEWIAMPSSRGSSWPKGLNLGIPHCRQIHHKQDPKEASYRWVLSNYLCKIHMKSCFPKYKSFNQSALVEATLITSLLSLYVSSVYPVCYYYIVDVCFDEYILFSQPYPNVILGCSDSLSLVSYFYVVIPF